MCISQRPLKRPNLQITIRAIKDEQSENFTADYTCSLYHSWKICICYRRKRGGKAKGTFVEIGLNRGQTLRELISLRQSTDRNMIKPIIHSVMGQEFYAKDFCFYGFEANKVFTKQTNGVEWTGGNLYINGSNNVLDGTIEIG